MKLLSYIFLTLLIGSCMEFRYSEQDMKNFLEKNEGKLQSDTFTIKEQKIHYVFSDYGHKVLVVFIHGSPGSWNAFSDYLTTDSLLSRYDMVSADRPGFGYSDYGVAEPSIQKQAFMINEVIKTFDHEVKILVGHSLGGPVIARMTMDEPELAQGLLFLAPSIDPEMEKYEWYRSWIKTKLGDLITPTDFWVSNEEIIFLKEELQDMLPLWNQIKVPCIVIHGTKDSFVPVENADFAQRMIADSLIDIRYLENERHFIPWSHAKDVVQAIDDLIEEIYSSGL